jgi:hypothetical protein
MLDKKKLILGIIFFGSLWGLLEALGISIMRGAEFPFRSSVLALLGVVVLMAARVVMPRAGSTAIVGIIAAGFKFLSLPNIFFCQIAAVIGQALIFDIAFTIAEKRKLFDRKLAPAFTAIIACYVSYLLFAFSQAYLFSNPYWLQRGIEGILKWVAIDGGIAAGLGFPCIYGGLFLGQFFIKLFEKWYTVRRPLFYAGLLTVSIACWILVAFLTSIGAV